MMTKSYGIASALNAVTIGYPIVMHPESLVFFRSVSFGTIQKGRLRWKGREEMSVIDLLLILLKENARELSLEPISMGPLKLLKFLQQII